MKYYVLKPEIAGELGDRSELVYEAGKIKEVTFLEYRFIGWQGDELLSTHPCFIVTESLQKNIVSNNLTGVEFSDIEVSFSDEFSDMYGDIKIPKFVQIICNASYEKNIFNLQSDFYFNKYKEMIVSEKAMGVLKQHKLDMCVVELIR